MRRRLGRSGRVEDGGVTASLTVSDDGKSASARSTVTSTWRRRASCSAEILSGRAERGARTRPRLSAVRYLDSTGVSMLLDLHRSLDARRQRFSVVLPKTSHLWRLFEITGLPSILRIGETLAEAKAAAKP